MFYVTWFKTVFINLFSSDYVSLHIFNLCVVSFLSLQDNLNFSEIMWAETNVGLSPENKNWEDKCFFLTH